jgi:PAS domain S-box-containing protein
MEMPFEDNSDELKRLQRRVSELTSLNEKLEAEISERRQSEERFRIIVDTTPECVKAVARDGTVLSVNSAGFAMAGAPSAEAVIGGNFYDFVVPDDRRQYREFNEMICAGGKGSLEFDIFNARGERRRMETHAAPMRNRDGTIVQLAVSRDITERKRAEERLRESELHLRLMTETIPEMLWSASPQGAIDYCNSRVVDYTGLPAAEIMGDGWVKILHPDDAGETIRAWKVCVAAGNPYRAEVRIFHAKDRAYRYCVTSALPLLTAQGVVVKWYGTVVDMHDWRQAQEELRSTQAELAQITRVMTLGALTASIAHEVNQPLAGIVTNASTCLRMLAAELPNVAGACETARRIIRDANRASEVITRLRALFSKRQVTAEPVDLNEAAQEVIALMSGELQKNHVTLRMDLAEGLPCITGDRIQLQQVILNLVRNASDAMSAINDRPRLMAIRTEPDSVDGVRLTVRDNGVGFDQQGAGRLFDAFYTTKSAGMGIGLSVSRSIIEHHQGRLWAESNDSPGASFFFSVPLQAKTAGDDHELTAILAPAIRDVQHSIRNS